MSEEKGKTFFNYHEEAEDENIKLTKSHLPKELERYLNLFNLLCEFQQGIVEYFKQTPPKKRGSVKETIVKELVLLILPRLVWSSKSFLQLVTRGYYYDGAIVYRSRLESIALCAYLVRNKEKALEWAKKGRIVGLSKFRLLKELGLFLDEQSGHISPARTKKLVEGYERTYGILSQFVHSDFVAVRSLVEKRTKPIIAFPVLPEFKEEEAKDALRTELDSILTLILLYVYGDSIKHKRLHKVILGLARLSGDKKRTKEEE